METIVTADIEYQEKLRKVVDAFASGDYDLFGTVCEDCILSDREDAGKFVFAGRHILHDQRPRSSDADGSARP